MQISPRGGSCISVLRLAVRPRSKSWGDNRVQRLQGKGYSTMMVTAEELIRERIAILEEKRALAISENHPERVARLDQLARHLKAELDKLITTGDPNAAKSQE